MIGYLGFLLGLVIVYALLSVAQNILTGYVGAFAFHLAVIFGIGAYTWALLSPASIAFAVLCVLLSGAAGGVTSGAVGYFGHRTRGDWEAVYTFCVQMAIFGLFWNWNEVFGGPLGFATPTLTDVFGIGLLLALGVVLVIGSVLGARAIERSNWGLMWSALREDERLAISLGARPLVLRLGAYSLAGLVAGWAGSLYAGLLGFVDPTPFDFMTSVLVLSGVILGGVGSYRAAIVGGAVVLMLPEALAWVGLPVSRAEHVRALFFGLCVAAVVLWRPQGLVGRFEIR